TIIEKDIDDLLAEQYRAGRISATRSAEEAILRTTVSFICVGTPATNNGHLDLTAIWKVSKEIGLALKAKEGERHVVAVRSTVLPGTGAEVARIIADVSGLTLNRDFAVVSN